MTSESVNNMNLVNCGKRAPDQSITTPEKSSATPPAHSKFRGVTKNRWTDRYQARLWDGTWKKQGAKRNGKPGAYDSAERAAKAYDVAAIKFWGLTAKTNFPGRDYEKEMKEMEHMTNEELVGKLRRLQWCFRDTEQAWDSVEARPSIAGLPVSDTKENESMIISVLVFTDTEEEAAVAYDTAALKHWGPHKLVATNFDVKNYDLDQIRRPELCHSKREINTCTATASEPKSACPYKFNAHIHEYNLRHHAAG
eukprot:PITA_14940